MDNIEPVFSWADLAWRVLAAFLGFGAVQFARWARRKLFIEYDRSILIRLGTSPENEDYAYAPIIVGQFPFSELAGAVEPNLDSRNVIGFVVGRPKWIRDVWWLHLGLDKNQHKAGYFAYCVIQWEHASAVRRFAERGFHVRRVRYNGPQRYQDMRETIFLGFGTGSEPDEAGDVPVIVHITDDWLASFRYQPYERGGFSAEDIDLRVLPPQTKLLIVIRNFLIKRRQNAR